MGDILLSGKSGNNSIWSRYGNTMGAGLACHIPKMEIPKPLIYWDTFYHRVKGVITNRTTLKCQI